MCVCSFLNASSPIEKKRVNLLNNLNKCVGSFSKRKKKNQKEKLLQNQQKASTFTISRSIARARSHCIAINLRSF